MRLVLAAGVVTSLTYLASNQWLFRGPWNLHIPVPYFVLFLFVTYLASIGDTRQFVAMSIAATVLVSTHISYAPLVLVGFAYAVTWTLIDARRSGQAPLRWRHIAVVCGAVWAVSWVAPRPRRGT